MIHFLLYLSIFRLLSFIQKLNMTFQDFHNLKSGHNATTELFKYGLFWKLSKNFGFHRNQCKMQILYGYATHTDTLFFQNQIHLFTGYTQFFHFMLFLLSKITVNGVQKPKGKHGFRKIEIIHGWHIVSSVAQKRNLLDFSNSSCK